MRGDVEEKAEREIGWGGQKSDKVAREDRVIRSLFSGIGTQDGRQKSP